jgi:hypothetical protein
LSRLKKTGRRIVMVDKTKKPRAVITNKTVLRLMVDSQPTPETRGMLPIPQLQALSGEIVELGKEAIRDSIGNALSDVMEILSSIPLQKGLLSVSEVKFTMTLDARGEVSILSLAKGSLSGSTGFQFTIQITE